MRNKTELHINGQPRAYIKECKDIQFFLTTKEKTNYYKLLDDDIISFCKYINDFLLNRTKIKESQFHHYKGVQIDLISDGYQLVAIDIYL